MDRTQELEEQVRRLSRTVEEMRGRVTQLEGGKPSVDDGPKRSRRGFLRMGAAAAAGALGWAAVRAVPAAAATGQYMVLGNANLAENATTLHDDAGITGGEVLGVTSQNFSQTDLDTALGANTEAFNGPLRALGDSTGTKEGLDAWANGPTGYAVWGLTDTGTAITGEALSGIGLYARTTGRIRQDPQLAAGQPGYSPNLMEQVRDSNGVLWIHNKFGVWRRDNTVRTDAADGSGNPYKPFRLVDTRLLGGLKAPGAFYSFTVAPSGTGASSIPSDAIAVVGNLTAVGYTGAGFLAIMPQGVSYNPSTDPSSLNFIVGQAAIANAFVCGLNPANGQLQVYVGLHSSHFIIDITAYIQ